MDNAGLIADDDENEEQRMLRMIHRRRTFQMGQPISPTRDLTLSSNAKSPGEPDFLKG